ncbi:MAG: hypothetical protein JXR83_13580 [Deltaproteobacteria bacterium]|nr:hypothetical protein [Deltaproteobacteria bacterium]
MAGSRLLRVLLWAALVLIFGLANCLCDNCDRHDNPVSPDANHPGLDGGNQLPDSGSGSVRGRLATPGNFTWNIDIDLGNNQSSQSLSLDEVTVDLRQPDPQGHGGMPDDWPVVATTAPDSDGVFHFENVPAGMCTLKLNQPEFADLAYHVDSTEFEIGDGETVTLVLPLVTTILHDMMDPDTPWNPSNDQTPAAALDHATGEVVLVSNLGLAVVDPGRSQMDLLYSRNFFLGSEQGQNQMGSTRRRVVALAPGSSIAWVLFPDRLVKVDRSLFTDPDASETIDLDLLATRSAIGDRFRFRMLAEVNNQPQLPEWTGDVYFSPDGRILYATTDIAGVCVFDLEQMEVVRVIVGQAVGYNPVSNHLFITNGDYGQHNGTDLLVVNASTFYEVNAVAIRNVVGVAAVPNDAKSILVRSQLSTGDVEVPFVVVIDGGGNVVSDQRASDYLDVEADPELGAPSFDLTGQYFMIGSSAFEVIGDGTFEPVPVAVPPGNSFLQRMQGNNRRAVDPANLLEIWYGNMWNQAETAVGLFSLDQTSIPVAVRPGVPIRELLLDRDRGRAIFGGFDRLVLVHYADDTAAGRAEVTDLSGVVAHFTQPGATCFDTYDCDPGELCAGLTDTAYSGRCTPNPRLPYLPFCGGFGQSACDDDFTCELVNPTNPNSVGECVGLSDREYVNSGPVCDQDNPCPTGMRCGAGGRCEPKVCLWDSDCAAYSGEICGLVAVLGRVCVAPGPLADGAGCLDSAECQHGACVGIESAFSLGDSAVLHGSNGLLACTTPCYKNADCPTGGQCVAETIWMPNGNNNGFSQLWSSHRLQVMPYCRPPNQPLFDDCATCTAEQLCANDLQPLGPHCQLGFNPSVFVAASPQPTQVCLAPAEWCNDQWQCGGGFQCKYPCLRSGDCTVFDAECMGGLCTTGSPCAMTCADDQVCGQFNWNHPFCVTADACANDADCGGVVGSCLFNTCSGPPTVCSKTSDCAPGLECVEWNWTDGNPYHCLPPVCGCSGADVGDLVCDTTSYTCVKACTSGADCDANEECVGDGWRGFFCGPPQCGCTGAHVGEMVCDQSQAPYKCVIPGHCTDVPCDGSVFAECNPTAPMPLPTDCRCPNCSWNNTCPAPLPVPVCATGFSCARLGSNGLPPRVGERCECAMAECQTP